ncbi:MAG TPA: CBASS oligonucleotide cyclase [Rhizomicrobium sp.]|nr:CBASS oligonucleotide cyclase [Rhizomicrobium sp.]
MATTIPQSFLKLRGNLEITTLQSATVSTRQGTVRQALEGNLKVIDTFLAGSYQRSTMIAPLAEADVDIFVILNAEYFHNYNGGKNGGPAGLLDLVKRTLLRTYTRTPDISRSGQAVTIQFSDFVADVVPAFNRQGGGYLIPNSLTASWLETDPKRHVELMSAANRAHDGALVPTIKMIKGWNKSHGAFFRSFHLEVLALAIFTNVRISDYPSAVRFFFDKARALITQKNPDPAGYGDDVGKYLNTPEKIQEASNRLQRAYERALKAEEFASAGNISNAVDMWQKTFGDYFPAYG